VQIADLCGTYGVRIRLDKGREYFENTDPRKFKEAYKNVRPARKDETVRFLKTFGRYFDLITARQGEMGTELQWLQKGAVFMVKPKYNERLAKAYSRLYEHRDSGGDHGGDPGVDEDLSATKTTPPSGNPSSRFQTVGRSASRITKEKDQLETQPVPVEDADEHAKNEENPLPQSQGDREAAPSGQSPRYNEQTGSPLTPDPVYSELDQLLKVDEDPRNKMDCDFYPLYAAELSNYKVEKMTTRSLPSGHLRPPKFSDVKVDNLGESIAALQLATSRQCAVRQDNLWLQCKRWTSRVQWYQVRPDTEVQLRVPGEKDNLLKARFWTMTRAKEVRTYSDQKDLAVADVPSARLASNKNNSDQDEVLGVWVIRDSKGVVRCQVALLRKGFTYGDLGIDRDD